MSEPRERLRLRRWLEDQINSGKVPGLKWLDREHTTFRITWKHAGKPDFDVEKDAVLFREWAIHTGKYNEGDQPDPSTWKTRFRCALHKMPDIEEIKIPESLDESEPYRVFRFKPRVNPIRTSTSATLLAVDATFQNDSNRDDSSCRRFVNTQMCSAASHRTDLNNNTPVTNDKGYPDWLDITPTLPPMGQWYPSSTITSNGSSPSYSDSSSPISQWESRALNYNMFFTQAANDTNEESMDMEASYGSNAGMNEIQAKLLESFFKNDPETQRPANILTLPGMYLPSMDVTSPALLTELTPPRRATGVEGLTSQINQLSARNNAAEYDLLIKAFYDTTMVVEDKVRFQNRLRMCRLYYGYFDRKLTSGNGEPAFNLIYGPVEAEQLRLPEKDLQVPEIKKVLENLNRGLVLELSETRDIYAVRLCRCKVFYSSGPQEPQKLTREAKTKVFDYEGQFVPALSDSLIGSCATPSYDVTFTLGYPNGSLVSIVITHAHAKREFQSRGSNENLCSEPNDNDIKARNIEQYSL